jgi:hypothetical protein
MRITAKEAKRLSTGKHTELDVICQRITAQSLCGNTQIVYYQIIGHEAREWLILNGYEVEIKNRYTTISWNKAST